MHELRISEDAKKLILDDIFGHSTGGHYSGGLVDAVCESMFNSLLEVMSSKWNMLDIAIRGWPQCILSHIGSSGTNVIQ